MLKEAVMVMLIGLVLFAICLAGLNLLGAGFPWAVVISPAILAGFMGSIMVVFALAQGGDFWDNIKEL